MRAVVLVGGFGTRLRPLTARRPKQMLPVVGVPMIERVVRSLGQRGITEAVLSLGYRPDEFLAAYPDGRCAGVALAYAVEPEPLDTAGAVRFAARYAGIDETFVVVNGDVLTDLDLHALLGLHRARGAEGTIALTPVDDPSRYGVVPIEPDGRVQAFIEKPPAAEAPSHWINAGTYVLEPQVIDRIPDDRPVSIERETFPSMAAEGRLFALQDDAYWVDAGTPATYLQVQLDLVDGRRGPPEPAFGPRVDVADTAVVEHSVLMAGATVGDSATVRDSVLLPGAVVEPGARVEGSVVGEGAVVGAKADIAELSVLGDGAVVEPGAQLRGVRMPEEDL